ncbi:sigma 54-interacting response regulator [Dyadobacter sp. CY345]|uniref:sigma 54-interacting response regulator n=1 Tax=Dyadobacter sp. CY345 TaxID=2909335 RepID=UPI001F37D5E9|nr:sigma 54-interacting response regulator [Dyadobacter sp. CY345]MCF2446605.1 sigma 54-interacting response regulator [Dyadobacter sp. CY345]
MNDNVLIVEDEFVVANDLRVILKEAGYRISGIAASFEEADEILQKHKPDLVLLDIRLDGKQSGIDLAKKLKAENIAFVYISANSSQEILEEAKTTDPYGFIVKPFRKKDLLVAIDIAIYRLRHSFESRLRQEEILQKQLAEISNNTTAPHQKLLHISKTIQAHIPFDLIVVGSRPLNASQFDDMAYLRIGYDEYQFIGKKELMTITGFNETAMSKIIAISDSDNQAVIYNVGISNQTAGLMTLPNVFCDAFKLQSYLVYPVQLKNGSLVHYFFYSRQPDIYTKNHIALLNRINLFLRESADLHPDVAVTSKTALPKSGNYLAVQSAFVPGFKGIVGSDPLLLAALDHTMQVAPYSTSILILGESGTGKENVALAVHTLSPRKKGPFIKVNCAAIPAALIESELYGHEKGSFTGAFEKRKGKFEQAEGGTIFLDEIGELPLEMQVKLLRVLQEKEIEYVGSNSSRKVNVRIIAATNRNLEKEVAKGTFRLDLYYRLNVFPITLPPLRERKGDIMALSLFFANKFCTEFNKEFNGIAESMIEEMQAYDWPGNIRELVNVIEQSVILNDGKAKLELMRSLTSSSAELAGKKNIETLEDVKHVQRETEREYIISILKKSKGLIRGAEGAAEILNIKPTTLESKMAKLGIRREDFLNPS